jgi:hypothetical protein
VVAKQPLQLAPGAALEDTLVFAVVEGEKCQCRIAPRVWSPELPGMVEIALPWEILDPAVAGVSALIVGKLALNGGCQV